MNEPSEQNPSTTPTAPEENGTGPRMAQVQLSLEIPAGARLRITVEALSADGETAPGSSTLIVDGAGDGRQKLISLPVPLPAEDEPAREALPAVAVQPAPAGLLGPLQAASKLRFVRAWPYSLEATLFGLALSLYLATRLVGLVEFPIYFFTDEAVQTVLAADLVRDNFHDYEKTLLPTYFKNGSQYNLSASVYAQVLPYLLFGKSIFVTRATSVLFSLLAAVSAGLILKNIFKSPYWWSGALLLSIAPAWFLHSRTAFETVLFVSFYSAMLYGYLLYRTRSPNYLYPTIGLAALAFYSYSPGQVVVGLTAVLLLLSDAGYHRRNREVLLRGLLLAALLALPYLRFRLSHPTAFEEHLKNLGSYWVQPLPLQEKLSRYLSEYLYGLSPGYWFVPNDRDLVRHLMKGYGHLLRATLPFALIGLALALKQIRSPAHRAVLIALLAAPAGAALVLIGVTRALVFVIPATLLTALGLSRALVWLESFKLPRALLAGGLFLALALVNLFMLGDALVNGPTWYQDYGLGGMQYGARQLFGAMKEVLKQEPGVRLIVSPTWSNGTDVVARFFLPDPLPLEMGSVDGHMDRRLPLDDNTRFVLVPEELERAKASGKFEEIQIDRTLSYPDGRPGFYFTRLRYVDNIDQILAAEREARRELLQGQVRWNGQVVRVKYPHLDMGEVGQAFDGNLDTVVRTLEANPLTFELDFPQPARIQGLYIKFGSTQINARVQLYMHGASQPIEYTAVLSGDVENPTAELPFDAPHQVEKMLVEIRDLHQGEPGHVHVWEIEIR